MASRNPKNGTLGYETASAEPTSSPAKGPRKKKLKNSIVIYGNNNDDLACAMKFKEKYFTTTSEIFLLPEQDSKHPKIESQIFDFSSDMPTADLKMFQQTNESLMLGETKCWRLQIDGKHFMLEMSSNQNYSDKIEELAIKFFLKKFGLSIENGSSKKTLPRRHEVKKIVSTSAENNQVFHETQKVIGDELKRKIVEKLPKSKSNDPLDAFEGFKFLILVPNRDSLEHQTIERLKDLKDSIGEGNISNVIKINISRDTNYRWREFLNSARDNPKILHLLIHDECHWAAGANQSTKKLLFENGIDYHQHKGKTLTNFFTVLVSATPFNFFTAEGIENNDIVDWKTALKQSKLPNPYQGLSELRKKRLVIHNEEEFPCLNMIDQDILKANGFTDACLAVISDYLVALETFKKKMPVEKGENSTKMAIHRCINENKLIIVRFPKSTKGISFVRVAKKVLKEAICQWGLVVEVLGYTHQEEDDDFQFLELRERALKNAKERDQKINHDNLRKQLQFSDVNGIPMIMFIVERGKMGDTFPPSCIRFDLRMRYLKTAKDFTTIVQDIGRAFGYGERPSLLLSKEANEFLNKVWNDDKNSVELSNFRGFLLGKNMKHKTSINQTSGSKQEQDESFLDIFLEKYMADPQNPVMLFGLGKGAFSNRIFLKAEPQIGKTGAFLYLVKSLSEKLNKRS